jgi:hypothetical protein
MIHNDLSRSFNDINEFFFNPTQALWQKNTSRPKLLLHHVEIIPDTPVLSY